MLLYSAKASSSTTSDLYTLDPVTAVATSIGPTGHAFTALAVDPTDGTLYGATSSNSAVSPTALFTIDEATGAATLMGAFNGDAGTLTVISDIAFDSTGQLYGYGGETGDVHVIDKSNGTYTTLGIGLGLSASSAALEFDSSDVLYLLARFTLTGTRLYTVSMAGIPTLVGDITPSTSLYPASLTVDADGLMWWLNGGSGGTGVRLHTLDVSTLAWATIGTDAANPGNTFDALAWSPEVSESGGGGGLRHVKFGDGLTVTDEGDGVIRVDTFSGSGGDGDGGSGGIQFETSPQEGAWLEVTTTGGAGPSGYDMSIEALGDFALGQGNLRIAGSQSVEIRNTSLFGNGSISIQAAGQLDLSTRVHSASAYQSGDINLTAKGNAYISAVYTVTIDALGGGAVNITARDTGNAVSLQSEEGPVEITSGDYITLNAMAGTQRVTIQNDVVMILSTGKAFDLRDNSGASLLRVDESGVFHIKTGASWVADL